MKSSEMVPAPLVTGPEEEGHASIGLAPGTYVFQT